MTSHTRDSNRMAPGLQGLYVIVDPEFSPAGVLATAEAALKGGAKILQWRDKSREKGLQLPECREIARLCERYDSLLIVNDHADLAVAAGAHGLHVGQKDLPVDEARSIMPSHSLIGTSNATLEEAIESQQLELQKGSNTNEQVLRKQLLDNKLKLKNIEKEKENIQNELNKSNQKI